METLSAELHQHGFKEFDDEPCLMRYFDKKTGTEIIAEIFVDDVKWCTNNTTLLSQIITKIGDKYQISVGDTKVNSKKCHTVN